jgi:hypothetical protein
MMKKKLHLYGPGICPKCREIDLNYDGYELNDEMLEFKWVCNVCGAKGVERYNIEFFEHEVF